MARNRLLLSLGLFLFAASFLQAQENRFVVFFHDKDHSAYTLESPESFLTARALARRERQNIPLTFNDLPVSEAYLDSLKAAGIPYFHTTKWFNAALIQTDSTKLNALIQASYVDTVIYVAPGAKLKNPYGNAKLAFMESEEATNGATGYVEDDIALDQNIALGVDKMHEQGYKGEGMLVAVFDGGFTNADKNPAFATLFEEDRVVATRNFVVNNDSVYQYDDHGARALSLIAGYIPGQFIGTAPEAGFVLCVTEDVAGEYRIEEYNWLFAAEFADSLGVDVVNTSLGYNLFSDSSMDYTYEDLDGETAVITRASTIAASKGMLLVTSAGNEGNKPWKYISAPADADSILAVGAIFTETFNRAAFSSFGPTADGRIKPDVSAPGYGVALVSTAGTLSFGNGTSFAAPLVTGLTTGFWQANPELNNLEVIERIKMSGTKALSPNNELGYGVPNFQRAMDEVILGTFTKIPKSFRIYPNPVVNNKLVIEMANPLSSEEVEVFLYDSTGKLIRKEILAGQHLAEKFFLNFYGILPGVYIINVVTARTSEAAKIIKF